MSDPNAPRVFTVHVWIDRDRDVPAGFTRSTVDDMNTLRIGPLALAWGIE